MSTARALVAAVSAALALAAGAAAATAAAPRPDAHDRALAARLNAKVATFRKIAGTTSQSNTELDRCASLRKHPQQALAAVFLLLPVFLAELVNDYGAQIRDLRDTIAAMHPHSPLFRRWLSAEGDTMSLLLQFDNHGKRVDVCKAVKVLLDEKSSDADIFRTIGIHTDVIGKLFGSTGSTAATKLRAPMRAFFVAAGLSAADAKTLTS